MDTGLSLNDVLLTLPIVEDQFLNLSWLEMSSVQFNSIRNRFKRSNLCASRFHEGIQEGIDYFVLGLNSIRWNFSQVKIISNNHTKGFRNGAHSTLLYFVNFTWNWYFKFLHEIHKKRRNSFRVWSHQMTYHVSCFILVSLNLKHTHKHLKMP